MKPMKGNRIFARVGYVRTLAKSPQKRDIDEFIVSARNTAESRLMALEEQGMRRSRRHRFNQYVLYYVNRPSLHERLARRLGRFVKAQSGDAGEVEMPVAMSVVWRELGRTREEAKLVITSEKHNYQAGRAVSQSKSASPRTISESVAKNNPALN